MSENMRNVKQAAAYLGISVKTLYKLTAARAVPFSRPGGGKTIVFSQEHLDAIIAAGEQPVIEARGPLRIAGTHPPAGPSSPPPPPAPKESAPRARRGRAA